MRSFKVLLGLAGVMAAGLLGALSAGAVGVPPTQAPTDEPKPHPPKPETVRTGHHAQLPDGPDWALRSYRTIDGQLCLQAGEESNGRVGRFGKGRFAEESMDVGGSCGDGRPFLAVQRELDMRDTTAREPSRTAAYGVLPADAISPVLILPSERRSLQLDDRGTFLVVVPENVTGRFPRVEWKSPDGKINSLGGDLDIGSNGAPR